MPRLKTHTLSTFFGHWCVASHVASDPHPRAFNTLLKSDVTRRDHVPVVMDAGSRIVSFIRDGTVFA